MEVLQKSEMEEIGGDYYLQLNITTQHGDKLNYNEKAVNEVDSWLGEPLPQAEERRLWVIGLDSGFLNC